MEQYSVTDASTRLSELADKAARGEKIIFVKGSEQFQILKISNVNGRPIVREPGTSAAGWMSPDFDAPLEDFEDYA